MRRMDVIIPAYNEEKNLPYLLKKMPRDFKAIVVDDGSTDKTAAIARKAGAKVISLNRNYGKGKACLEGFKECKSKYCAIIDGDGQLNPYDIKKMIPYLEKYDLVIGQREMKKVPFHRRLSNKFSTWIINFVTGGDFKDVLCGLRAFKKNKFKKIKFEKLGYCFEAEMIVGALKAGLSIKSVNVKVDYNKGSRMGILKSIGISLWLIKLLVKKLMGMKNV